MAKDEKIMVKFTRKQAAPRNLAAKALREGQFQPKVEEDPKGYKRHARHQRDPILDEVEDEP